MSEYKNTIENMIGKYNACVDKLDKNKHCETCKHSIDKGDVIELSGICYDCYDIVLALPINPTKWEGR